MAKEIIFIGGGDYRKSENAEIDDYLVGKINKSMKILIIPFATEEENYVSWASALYTNFRQKGISHFGIVDYGLSSKEIIRRINASDVLFVTGGLPNVLMARLREKKIIDAIRSFKGIIIGYSAGALVLSRECIILPEKGHPSAEIIDGLGFSDFSTYVHYQEEQDEYLLSYSKNRRIYAITDRSAVAYTDGKLSFIGKIFLFSDGKKQQIYPR